MTMEIICPKCGARLRVTTDGTYTCPRCGYTAYYEIRIVEGDVEDELG